MDRYCYVFYVTHRYVVAADRDGSDISEIKEIGVYTSHRLAALAVQRFSVLPGFSAYPDCFSIARVQCFFHDAGKKEELSVLYAPYCEAYQADSDYDYIQRGVFFEAESDADAILQQWKASPKPQLANGEYAVLQYTLNQDIRLWAEGFDR